MSAAGQNKADKTTVNAAGLLPCPFCGVNAFCEETYEDAKAFRWRAECWDCPAEMRAPTREAVTLAWNTRAALASEPEPQPVAVLGDGSCLDPWSIGYKDGYRDGLASSPHLAETAPDQEGQTDGR